MSKVIVTGGGAAGMMAAIRAAECGHSVELIEHNEKLGKKVFITGKGRCNLTNASDMDEIFNNIVTNPKFLYSALYTFSNEDVMRFFENSGLKIKTERGGRVFPVSDKSSDVIKTLEKKLKDHDVNVRLNSHAEKLIIQNGKIKGIIVNGKKQDADAVIMATGGLSYKSTGSDGSGFDIIRESGHTTSEFSPALVPIVIKEDYPKKMQGVSLKNIEISILNGNKSIYSAFGEMLFTHFGISGPVVLSASSIIIKYLKKGNLTIKIDLKPALTEEQLDARILRDFEDNINRDFKNSLSGLLPKKMIPSIIRYSGIPEDKKINNITREERRSLVKALKGFTLTIEGLRGYDEAIITQGGVNVKEINPATMESKLVKGLYFAGEMIDIDAFTGGYNLQLAWSTGYLAGNSIE
ncbi:MAG: NAD(P)/FAD-dependent oxidoreductase [Lachnospiraceae bacterium]|nr:NAD(P)/FAD-dependent oxidoreductase [Lachnospiraceae bacterium]MDE6254094.1 NAD(P)/FAD-dependent oxidoreductase [Lachnospiraceae bacterium]